MGASQQPFDFSQAMHAFCEDVARRVDEFRHIQMDRVAVTFAQTRRRVSHGLQAKLTPMRFEDGRLWTRRNGRTWTVQRLFDETGREMLYILTFYLPRFLDHPFREKLVTIFHELYHIGPRFDGDLRRFGGRYHVHSKSQKEYDALAEQFADVYLSRRPPERIVGFLRKRFNELERLHGRVVGLQVPIPKLFPLPQAHSA